MRSLGEIDEARRAKVDLKSSVEREAILKIWTGAFGMMEKLFSAVGAVAGCVAGFVALRVNKRTDPPPTQ